MPYLEPGRGRPRPRRTLTQRLWWIVLVLTVLVAAGALARLF
jgi:hypothetical protein